jgi:uncharacterized protein
MVQQLERAPGVSERVHWPTIDADAHVIDETEHTWDFLEPSESKYRPVQVAPLNNPGRSQWLIEGELRGPGPRPPARSWGITVREHAPELEDVAARLEHMDEIGTDIQVMHNTLFGSSSMGTFTPECELALYRSWNRWVADATKESNGQLRWSALLPVQTMDEAVKELEWVVQHGACGVFMPPVGVFGLLTNPQYHPVYEAAERLNVPITVHVGNADRALADRFRPGLTPGASAFTTVKMFVIACCHSVLNSRIQKTYPRLRWGFLEAGAGWVPHVLHDLAARTAYGNDSGEAASFGEVSRTVLADNRIYAAYENYEDLVYVLKYAGEDNLVAATDYGHTGQTAIVDALFQLRQRAEAGEADQRVVDKMLRENPARLFGIEPAPAAG